MAALVAQNNLGPQYTIEGIYELRQDFIFDFSKTDFQYFYGLFDAGSSVPLHQELLEEVKTLMYSASRRSTYLILYTTLEVATKTLIKTLKPDTDYLVSKFQSPDLYKLYTEYINTEIVNLVDKDGAQTIRNMGSVRNDIAHQGKEVNMDTLQRHYEFVNDLIKKIEVAMGYEVIQRLPFTPN